jgi:hypothetical protein
MEGTLRNQKFLIDHAGHQLRHPRYLPGPPRTPIHRHHQHQPQRRHQAPHLDLAGASVWTGDLLSQTWRDRLLGATAGALLTIAGLWFALVTGATISYVLRG